ncbi:ABC transporter ATP-binding protein [Deminuibacter soli]|uniref:ATP-binding cassette domain-containing protein n=1 Tax=Deminuibacter soli TaxID=2291815 RepID=A0A3E1NFG1_9BACT|nr:ATP-binding cassette domain-containing protein [Deminuibacter soli]RFM26715.1 ATP-binding cassette domain-containing protein [Deminuibacter soli]
MIIELSDAGKRFNRDWIFRHITYRFTAGESYAVTGSNGSGKSTLLQVLAGSMDASEGKVAYTAASGPQIQPDAIFRQLAIAAPYLELIEELTALEFLTFHAGFKPFMLGITPQHIIAELGMEAAAGKQIRFYSSGMKQRIKLAQAIFADCPLLLLDEPCTNLDQAGYALYHRLIEKYAGSKLVIVSSNDVNEYDFCRHQLRIADYK